MTRIIVISQSCKMALEQTNNKTIAKNTLFLYFRMMFTMVVSLYTSRVILQKLGVDDFGIYQAVGGIVGFLSFINGALATGSSRFITFALGENNAEKLKRTFSTTLNVHILLAVFIVLIAETVGLWFLYNKMVIPADRMSAAIITYHLSIVAAVVSITAVPYNASIVSHERMSIYAYMSIYEVCAKLGICYLLSVGNIDRLILYTILLLIVQCSTLFFYRIYCIRNFSEARFSFTFDKRLFKEIAGFSSWSMFAAITIALNNQGILVLLNMFFTPATVAARAISLQVNAAANQFVSNFRQAANPQIVKKFASGDYSGSKSLLLSSTRYSYYMMLVLCLPIFLLAEPMLTLWLGVVPEYTVAFLQIVIVQSLFQVFDTSFYIALYAKGRLKENVLLSNTLALLMFPITYLLFKMGYSPLALSWISLIVYAIAGIVIKPLLIIKIVDYTWSEIWSVFKPSLLVSLLSIPLPLLAVIKLDTSLFVNFLIVGIVCVLSTGLSVWFMGLDKLTRDKLLAFAKGKISR